MDSKCLMCGAEELNGSVSPIYRCGSYSNGDGTFSEGYVCLRNQLAAVTKERDELKLQLNDERRVGTERLDDIWGIVYPGMKHWKYPGMVYGHVKELVNEERTRADKAEGERDKWMRLFAKQSGKLNAAEAELAKANGLLDNIHASVEYHRFHDKAGLVPDLRDLLARRNKGGAL